MKKLADADQAFGFKDNQADRNGEKGKDEGNSVLIAQQGNKNDDRGKANVVGCELA